MTAGGILKKRTPLATTLRTVTLVVFQKRASLADEKSALLRARKRETAKKSENVLLYC